MSGGHGSNKLIWICRYTINQQKQIPWTNSKIGQLKKVWNLEKMTIFMTSSNAQFEEFFGQKINIFVNKIQQTQEVFCYLLLSAI